MLNALSVDVEDYFHVEAFSSRINREDWHSYECRVELNVDLTLEILSKRQTLATFFILGCVAEQYPRLVRKIADAGRFIVIGRQVFRLSSPRYGPWISWQRKESVSILPSFRSNMTCTAFPIPNVSHIGMELFSSSPLRQLESAILTLELAVEDT
jgi:peptidoglycan/xylan/chitin deacetylase (PgdA/CDA1 family)